MKTFWFGIAFAILMLSLPAVSILRAQDGGPGGGGFGGGGFGGDSVDLSGLIGDRGGRGGGNFGNRGGTPLPDSKQMYSEIQSILKKGKTPLQKVQERPLVNFLDQEVVNLSDRIQLLRNNNQNNFDRGGNFPPGGFPGGDFPPGGFPGGGDFSRGGGDSTRGGNNASGPGDSNNNQINTLNVQIETLTSIKNDDFVDNKLSLFLSPEQVALVKKAKAEDKANTTCLGGMLDRSANPLQNNNGGGRGGRGGNNNFNPGFNNNETKKTNGQPFCMTQEATASQRLEPIRKVLATGNLPLAKDKEAFAEIFMKSQIKDLDDGLRSSLTSGGNRGGLNRNNNQQQIIQSSTDEMYKKAGAMLEPAQAETLKKWHMSQILSRGGIDSLITVEAMQDTPLSDDQIARISVAFSEYRSQILSAAKSSKQNPSAKDLDNAATGKVLNLLDAKQIASYQVAKTLATSK